MSDGFDLDHETMCRCGFREPYEIDPSHPTLGGELACENCGGLV